MRALLENTYERLCRYLGHVQTLKIDWPLLWAQRNYPAHTVDTLTPYRSILVSIEPKSCVSESINNLLFLFSFFLLSYTQNENAQNDEVYFIKENYKPITISVMLDWCTTENCPG